jgi:hypothetical protein
MKRLLTIAAILLLPLTAVANPLYIEKDSALTDPAKGATGGTKISAASFNSGTWTGWMRVRGYQAVCFDIFHDYTAATGVTMRCESSESYSTTADAGYDIESLDCAGGTCTSNLLTFTKLTGADARWSWCVDGLPGSYIECLFDDVASGAAGDKITVVARGITP